VYSGFYTISYFISIIYLSDFDE